MVSVVFSFCFGDKQAHARKKQMGIKTNKRSIITHMKRFVALVGVVLLLLGVRYYDAGLRSFTPEGELTIFADAEYTPDMFVPSGADCYRIDIAGRTDIDKLLEVSMAKVQLLEMDGQLIYAYSPRIPKTEWIHGKRVNIMIYAGESNTVLGVPIIKGSY